MEFNVGNYRQATITVISNGYSNSINSLPDGLKCPVSEVNCYGWIVRGCYRNYRNNTWIGALLVDVESDEFALFAEFSYPTIGWEKITDFSRDEAINNLVYCFQDEVLPTIQFLNIDEDDACVFDGMATISGISNVIYQTVAKDFGE